MEIDSIVKASKGLHSPNNAMQTDHRAGFTMIWPTSILKNFSIWPSPYAPNDFYWLLYILIIQKGTN